MVQTIQSCRGSTHATIKSLYEPNVSYEELIEGARFEILEGSRVVGYGEVLRKLNGKCI
jgi:hypothetical protein